MVRLIVPFIAIFAIGSSVAIVAGSVRLADEIAPPPPEVILDPPPGLPATWRDVDRTAWSGSSDPGLASQRSASLDETIRSAAKHFGVPHAILRSVIREAVDPRATHQHPRLTALRPEAMKHIGLSGAHTNDRLVAELVEFLGRDMRPFDSRLSQDPAIGTALRATHLITRRAATHRTVAEHGLDPTEETGWFLAMLAHERGDREVAACVVEAIRLGPERIGTAFTDLDATAALLSEPTFLLRSFLRKWKKEEALERRKAFRHSVMRHHAAPTTSHPATD